MIFTGSEMHCPLIEPNEAEGVIPKVSKREISSTRRKSVENLMLQSHDVIGHSINQALTISSGVTTSAAAPSSPQIERRRTPSPSLSPHSSPKPRHKREQSRTEVTHLSVPLKDGQPQSQTQTNASEKGDYTEDAISRSSDSSQLADLSRSVSHDSERERGENHPRTTKKDSRSSDRSKKKSSWYNVLYPTYKSRSEDFKRIFKDIPDDERLVVDYSCAMQKDILVHGRLYISQNYLCFYANIFRWETSLSIKWNEVTAITKEKTALVIPNAILVCTRNEKHFFTSFAARDKAFLMLFRVWQHALMDQPTDMQTMWQWVHTCYGDELGLTSEDEDYIPPHSDEYKLSRARLSVESFSEECLSIADSPVDAVGTEDIPNAVSRNYPSSPVRQPSPTEQLPTDMSDTTESDADKNQTPYLPKPIICPASHAGRQLVRIELPIHIDALFTLLFTGSRFLVDFHTARNTQDFVSGSWIQDPVTGVNSRTVTLTVALTQPVGPRSSHVTEKQIMLPCSTPGHLYAIDIDSINAGIPYAESFYIVMHYCLTRTGDQRTCFSAHAQIKYKKSVWGVVKGFIEKNTWAGLEDFYDALLKALAIECEISAGGQRKVPRRRRRVPAPTHGVPEESIRSRNTISAPYSARGNAVLGSQGNRCVSNDALILWGVFCILIILVFLNATLYYKLWAVEERAAVSYAEMHVIKNPPKSHDEWLRVLQRQESLHSVEMRKWQRVLNSAIQLLRKTEQSLNELQLTLQPSVAIGEQTEVTSTTPNIKNSEL